MSSSETTRHIGLYGGSFNPPHVCHTMATLWALQTTPIEQVWWLPTYQHAFGKDLADFDSRVAMCELATAPIRGASVHTIERELGGESRTIDTVEALGERHPGATFWLIIGTDILAETSKWKQWDLLMERVELVVVGRQGYAQDEKGGETPAPSFALPGVSSTLIREALLHERWDDPLLDDWMISPVLDYIRAHSLFCPSAPSS